MSWIIGGGVVRFGGGGVFSGAGTTAASYQSQNKVEPLFNVLCLFFILSGIQSGIISLCCDS